MYSLLKMGIFHCYVWLPEGIGSKKPRLGFSSFQDTVRKMCNLVSIRLASDAVVFAGTQEACEHAVKFLESQIKHLGAAPKKSPTWLGGGFKLFFIFTPNLGEDSHFD